jgi:hypothetical protein
MMPLPPHLKIPLSAALDDAKASPRNPEALIELANCYLRAGTAYIESGDFESGSLKIAEAEEVIDALNKSHDLDLGIQKRILDLSAFVLAHQHSTYDLWSMLACVRRMSQLTSNIRSRWPNDPLWQIYFARIQFSKCRLELYIGNYACARKVVEAGFDALRTSDGAIGSEGRDLWNKLDAIAKLLRFPAPFLIVISISARLQFGLAHCMRLRQRPKMNLLTSP